MKQNKDIVNDSNIKIDELNEHIIQLEIFNRILE
jgi:hypothetical protein